MLHAILAGTSQDSDARVRHADPVTGAAIMQTLDAELTEPRDSDVAI